LSRQARQALDVAAVIGQDFDIDLVTAFTGDEQWVTELLQHGLVVEVAPGRAAFRHALTREACYAEVEWPRRRNLHRQLAAHLDATGASPAIVAGHWLAGRDTDRARTALLTAAEEAGRVGAYRDAGRAFGRALDLWPEGTEETERLEALDRMGQCAEMAGNLAEAARIWREVADALRLRGENRKVAVVERRLAGAYELQGDWERALVARDAAANEFVVENLHGDAAAERLLAAAHLRSAGSFRAALGVLQLAQSEAEQAERWDLQARIIGLEGNLRARLGESEAGLALVRAGLALALEHNLTGPAAELYQRLADSLEHGGNYSGAKEAYGAAFAFCRAQDLPTTAQLCLACLTVVLRQTGEWQQSALLCRDVLAAQEHSPHAHAVAAGTLGAIHALRGQGRRAKPLLIEASAVARRIELAAMELLSTWGLALVDELDGDRDSAIARCTALIERWTMTEDRHYTVPVLHWAVTYCAEQGADAEAHACAAALAQIAASTGQPEALAALAHALGETALLGGDAMGASIQFGQALDLLRNLDLPLERAQVARRAAAALVLVDQREAAIDHLSNAYRLARRLGARPLAARVTHQLTELGEPVERHIGRFAARQHAGGGLSRREAEVLRLVAAGKTSRQIGDSLYLSPRTVEMHVQHILGKLDCYTRAEAVRKATALGLLG
jgi:DNA-binding CsgD family transcriptional regulator